MLEKGKGISSKRLMNLNTNLKGIFLKKPYFL